MLEMIGRIFTTNKVSEKSCQVVIKKTIMGKVRPISFNVFGVAKFKFEKQQFNKNDKVVIKYIPQSSLYNGKWYTELCLMEISIWVKKPKYDPYTHSYQQQPQNPIPNNDTEFDDEDNIGGNYIVDEESGEILF
jgi:hypothetical protein